MLGKKCSLTPLKEELRKQGVSTNEGSTSTSAFTAFDQGLFMRPLSAGLFKSLLKQFFSPTLTSAQLGFTIDF